MAAETEAVVRALYSRLSPPAQGSLLVTDELVRLVDRNAPIYWRNAVFHSVLSEDRAATTIDSILQEQRSIGLPLGWYVSPLTKPAQTRELLLARGFTLDETMLAMIARPAELILPEHDDDIEVSIVDESTLGDWFYVHRIGWKLDSELVRNIEREARERIRAGTDMRVRFIARIDGEPAGIANNTTLPAAAHFYGSVVLEPFRRRGVYAALFRKRVEWVREHDFEYVTVHCLPETSAPICRRYGFRDVCEIECYRLTES